MAFDAHKNFAVSTVATAPSPATSGTSLVVAAGEGAKFPAAPFNATVWPASTQPTSANAEIVRVTNISTDTLTITRAQEASSARTVVVSDQIAATITAKTLTDVENAIPTLAVVLNALQPVGIRVHINPFHADSANTNWSTLVGASVIAGCVTGSRESSGAQNAEVTFKVALAAGTWKLHIITILLNNAGIMTISLDTVSQGTIDNYNAGGFVANSLKTLTGITAATSALHDLNFKMATKNASSGSYFGDLMAITLERTA